MQVIRKNFYFFYKNICVFEKKAVPLHAFSCRCAENALKI